MSAPSADPKASGGAGAVIGIAAALMICATLAAFLIMSRGGAVDGARLLETTLGSRSFGTRYSIVEAREMPTGTRVVILDDPSRTPDPAPSSAAGDSSERVDWRKVTIPPGSEWPWRIVLTLPKEGSGQSVIDAFFAKSDWVDVADLGPQGGKVVVDSKTLAWRGFDARWVHERAYELPSTFRDAMSVNLSTEKQPCVLSAFWSRGETASLAKLEALLKELDAQRR